MMPGAKYAEIVEALADGFDAFELQQMLQKEMSQRLDRIVASGRLDQVVFELVGWADRHGVADELIRAAYRAKPRNDKIQSVYQKYGLPPAAELQKAGVPQPQPETIGGLEKTCKLYLRELDVDQWRTNLARLEPRVCRVEVNDDKGTMGTGFLVGPEALLTTYHVLQPVLKDPAKAAAVRFRFDYKRLPDGLLSGGSVACLRADGWLLDHSPMTEGELQRDPDRKLPDPDELDYVLVRLERAIGGERVGPHASANGAVRGWLQLEEAAPPVTPGMPLFILQHPRGETLKLTLDTDSVLGLNENQTRVRYLTNTGAGASGAPCFTIDWALLAMHHFGDPTREQVGKYNQGVPIGLIRARIAKNAAARVYLGGRPS